MPLTEQDKREIAALFAAENGANDYMIQFDLFRARRIVLSMLEALQAD